jgi:hypothetical protein
MRQKPKIFGGEGEKGNRVCAVEGNRVDGVVKESVVEV